MRRTLFTMAMVMVMAAAAPALAQGGPPGGGGPGGGGPGGPPGGDPGNPPPGVEMAFAHVVEFLQLDEAQAEAWRGLLETHLTAERAIREEMEALRTTLDELLAAVEPDAQAIGEAVLAQRGLGDELRLVHETYLEDFAALLTEEQAGRLEFIRRADRAQPILPDFRIFELIPRR